MVCALPRSTSMLRPCRGRAARRYYHIIQTLTETCREAGLADPVVCGYDWRQSVKFVAESWVGPLIWQHVGNRKKVPNSLGGHASPLSPNSSLPSAN